MTEHTILVAFTVEADTREQAHENLLITLPEPNGFLDSWWVAEDDRTDGSDCDSAVFVHQGKQHDASLALARLGYTPEHNVVGEPDGERFIVTTTVTERTTGKPLAPVSLDSPGVTRTRNDAISLRNSYVLTIGSAGAVGSPARIYPEPSGDREAWVVEYLTSTGELSTREVVTIVRAENFEPHVRHTLRNTTCPACGNSGTTADFLDTHTCVNGEV